MKQVLAAHLGNYPAMELADCIKLLYQSEFAGGHMITNARESLARLEEELAQCPPCQGPLWEPIGGGLCRLHLAALPRTQGAILACNRLFVAAANQNKGSRAGLLAKLQELDELCQQGQLPYDPGECSRVLEEYRGQDCPATHHSGSFRQHYAPHYRVVERGMAQYFAVFMLVEELLLQKHNGVLAVDGCSGSGKSHLAQLLQRVYGCGLVHMDDFFLQLHQRSPQRLAQPGGNFDRERFAQQVLPHLGSGQGFFYQAYDCSKQQLGAWQKVVPQPFVLVEGVYALHPDLRGHYDGAVFLELERQQQLARIAQRSGLLLQRFVEEWIPLEDAYFEHHQVAQCCKLRLNTGSFEESMD